MVNIGQIPGQVPEPINERVQESGWIFLLDGFFSLIDGFFMLLEFLVSIL
jgi:hypothetical protein